MQPGRLCYAGCFLLFRERTGHPAKQPIQGFQAEGTGRLPGRPEQNAVPTKGDNMCMSRAGTGLPVLAVQHHILSVHTAASSKGAAALFCSTHFYQILNQITKEYSIFITGVPAILRVRLFFVHGYLYFLPFRCRAPPFQS